MTTRAPFVARDLDANEDGDAEFSMAQPGSHQFSPMALDLCQDHLYVFGGRWNSSRLIWQCNLLTGAWTKIPIRGTTHIDPECMDYLQWTTVPFFAVDNDDDGDGTALMAMLPIETDQNSMIIELFMLRIVLGPHHSAPYAEIKSVPDGWPKNTLNPAAELVRTHTGDFLLASSRSNGRQFYYVPSPFDHCAEIWALEYDDDDLSKKWQWRHINQDIKENDPVFGAMATMAECQFIPFIAKWHGKCAIYFLAYEEEEDLRFTEKSREEHYDWLNRSYSTGTQSQKRLLIFTIDAQQWSVVDVHPDATFGFPIYRSGAAHDVADNVLFLVGGVKRNMYLPRNPINEQNKVFDEIWTLDLTTLTWKKLVHCRLQTPVFNASAKYSTENGSLYVFGGVTTNKSVDGRFVKPPCPLQRIQLDMKSLRHICAEKICNFMNIPDAKYSNTYQFAKMYKNLYL